ncbi:MAG: glycosyltransferase family 4 protein [Cytophagales bacterium]|nr:glycosyltransferase family 4 protein [Cytophagales bacterium]
MSLTFSLNKSLMKRVLCVGNYFYPKGGSDRYFINLVQLLNEKGYSAIPFTTSHKLNETSKWSSYFLPPNSTDHYSLTSSINLFHSRAAQKSIRNLLSRETVNIAHLNIYSQFSSSILAPLKESGIPIVQTLHDYKPVCPTYSFYRQEKICEACGTGSNWQVITKKCNRGSYLRSFATLAESYFAQYKGSIKSINHFISVCEFQRQKLLQYNILPEESITTIPNFIDTKYFSPTGKKGQYLLYFGRVEEYKGLHTLINAVAPLKHINLVIAGEGSVKEELQEKVTHQNLNHITFLPFQQNQALLDLISGALCTVIPSKVYELCPMSILESFALEKMVIGTNEGGIPELITDQQNGLLFKSDDEFDLRAKIVSAFDKKQNTIAMGVEGRKTVEEKYNIHRHYEALQKVYNYLS